MKIPNRRPNKTNWKKYFKYLIPYFVVLVSLEISFSIIINLNVNVNITIDLTFMFNFIGIVIFLSSLFLIIVFTAPYIFKYIKKNFTI